ncbi:MAG TPA: hypothetical protein ENH06_01290, partial [bacterium]|nr:hypothetical protein [bacterium]
MNPVRNSKNPYFYLLKRLKSRRKKREISNGVKKTIFIFSFAIFLFSSLGVNAETLGEQRSFYVQKDYDLSQREEIQAKLVKVTSELYFYIDSEWWNSSSQNQVYSSLSVLDEEFKNTIYPVLTSTFGQEWKPGIDNDEKITILIHPMIAEAGGYFNSGNEYPNLQVTDSNEREMVYLNAEYIGNLQMKSYLAHEFVHLIAFNQKERMYGDSGEIWLNEARADYAPTLLGYDDVYVGSNLSRRVSGFLEKPSDSLTEWKSKDSDYGVANLFIQYLVDHYGVGILVDSLKSPKQGIDSINYALNNNGFNKDFSEVFTDWTIAVLVNDCKIGELYCYLNPGLKN